MRLFGDLRSWVEREHREVDIYLNVTRLFWGLPSQDVEFRSPECKYGDSNYYDTLHTCFLLSEVGSSKKEF